MSFKSGFVNIVGNPNVGKSTLMNALVGERLSIITAKAQTTRHRILGIINGEDYQIVVSDTPGVLKPNYKLQESMMKFVHSAVGDADVILYVTDVVEKGDKNKEFLDKLNHLDTPIILVINKIDLTTPEKLDDLVDQWKELLPRALIYPVSAKEKFNVENVLNRLLDLLPQGPEYYSKDTLTDRNLRFFTSEIVREKILLNYQKEIPYCAEVVIDSYKEGDDMDRIEAIIYVMRDSQKGILIGNQGKSLKRVGVEARRDLEAFLGKKVYLGLQVRVNPDWRDDQQKLKGFGYILE